MTSKTKHSRSCTVHEANTTILEDLSERLIVRCRGSIHVRFEEDVHVPSQSGQLNLRRSFTTRM
jgi:hypothetical protein